MICEPELPFLRQIAFDKRIAGALRSIARQMHHSLRVCQRGEWNDRTIIETTLSMLTLVYHFKKVMHRKWVIT